jgi:hypothetical protein
VLLRTVTLPLAQMAPPAVARLPSNEVRTRATLPPPLVRMAPPLPTMATLSRKLLS